MSARYIRPHQSEADHLALLVGGLRLGRAITGVRAFKQFLDRGEHDHAAATLVATMELLKPYLDIIDAEEYDKDYYEHVNPERRK